MFRKTKKHIVKLLEELDQCPETSFERDIVCEEEDSFQLGTDQMNAIEELQKKVKISFSDTRF